MSAQRFKTLLVNLPIPHRKALDLVKEKAGGTIKELIMEGIEAVAVQHGIVTSGDDIKSWPEWD